MQGTEQQGTGSGGTPPGQTSDRARSWDTQRVTPALEQPSEVLELSVSKAWRNVKPPGSEEEQCCQLEAATDRRRPEDRLELPAAAGWQFCSAGVRQSSKSGSQRRGWVRRRSSSPVRRRGAAGGRAIRENRRLLQNLLFLRKRKVRETHGTCHAALGPRASPLSERDHAR